ncbi:MAG: hypothetical protein WDN31_15860 [Hyphomicrobium sp.]
MRLELELADRWIPGTSPGTTGYRRRSAQYHSAQQAILEWTALPEHIHHATDDLTAFLAALPARLKGNNGY